MQQTPVREYLKDLVKGRCDELRDKLHKVLPDVHPTYEEECEGLRQKVEVAIQNYEAMLLHSLNDC